jgi:methyltransferase (TIGR00027 family)
MAPLAACEADVMKDSGVQAARVPEGVGRTAISVARIRAAESRRPDRLFDDPYASSFVAAAPGALPERRPATAPASDLAGILGFHVVIRTRFFDDYLLAACTDGIRQVVLLAAGLDSRAFRLPWPAAVRLLEVDLPEVLAFKEQVLSGHAAAPRCHRVAVTADLREAWPAALTEAGFDPGRPTAWLVEGLLIYLSAEQAARLLTSVTELSGPQSRLAFERGGTATADSLSRSGVSPGKARLTALWQGGLGEDPAGWLRRHGWQVSVHGLDQLADSYGRPAAHPTRSGFVTARRSATGHR